MYWKIWVDRWRKTLKACEKIGGETKTLEIASPANEKDIIQTENQLGLRLPKSFRTALLEFSSCVEISWSLPEEPKLPDELRHIFRGSWTWDLKALPGMKKDHKDWIENCFSNPDDPYDKVWYNKLPFIHCPNGDYIAFDLKFTQDSPVVYLSHDDGKGHGYKLGDNFIDFVDRWSLIGSPGPEEWQLTPFIESATSGIDPNCDNAIKWRFWLGLYL